VLSAIQIPARDPLVGVLLDGRYHVTGVLGRGGMGIVYEGLHQPLGRSVAIKVLGPNTASDPVVVARFLREARVASGLAHGNIVDVSDLGRLPDGRPYLVMPKVAGIDFATLIEREGRMPPARVANLLRGVAAALDLVHAKGLVHRDVKPENLMHVVRADGSETVMLLDFGIAALLAHNAVRLTQDDMMCGSPAYMAPELIATGTFDRRADVYALATVAFELLAGCLPFDDALPMRVMVTKTERPAPSLSEAAEHSFSEDVERVIARGLARDPAERYASAGEFVEELALAAGEAAAPGDFTHTPPSSAASSGVRSVPGALDSTRPIESAASSGARRTMSLAVLATAAAVGVLLAWWLAPRAGVTPSAPASRAAHKAPARPARPEAEDGLSRALPAGDAPARDAVSEPAPQAAAPQAVAPIAPEPTPRTAVPAARGARLIALPPAARAPVANDTTPPRIARGGPAQRDAQVSRDGPGARDAQNARDAAPAADGLTAKANQELLQGHLGRAVELFEEALSRDARDVVALRGLGLAYERLGHSAEAARAYRKALAIEPNASLAPKLRERLARLGPIHD
jgi:serine/threonine-protein kinase